MTLLLPGAARLKYENVGKHEINDRNPGQPGAGGGTRRDTQSDTSASITLHTAQRELVFNWAHANVYPVTKTPDNDSFYNTFGRPILLSKVPSTGVLTPNGAGFVSP